MYERFPLASTVLPLDAVGTSLGSIPLPSIMFSHAAMMKCTCQAPGQHGVNAAPPLFVGLVLGLPDSVVVTRLDALRFECCNSACGAQHCCGAPLLNM